MSEKHNVRDLMVRLMDELGVNLSPTNDRLVSYKITNNGNKAVLKGWGWTLTLELRGSCFISEGSKNYLTDPEVDWNLELSSRCSFEDMKRLQGVIALLGL